MADQTYTLTRGLAPTGNNVKKWTHVVEIDFEDVNGTNAGGTWTTDGDTVTLTIGTTGPDFVITAAAANIETAFSTDGTLTYSVGTDGDVANFLTATDALTAGPEIAAAGAAPATLAGSFAAASDTLVVQFATQAATGAPADIDAGKLVVWLEMFRLNDY